MLVGQFQRRKTAVCAMILGGAVSLSVLGGCVSTATGGGASTYRIAQLRDIEADVTKEVDSLQSLRIHDGANLPTTGRAAYEGIMSMSVPTLEQANPAELVYGLASVDADFAAAQSTLNGSLTGFRNLSDEAYDGTLTLAGSAAPTSQATSNGFTLSGSVQGALSTPDKDALTIDAEILADAYGESAQAISGTVFGTGQVEAAAGTHGTSSTVFGTFLLVAE